MGEQVPGMGRRGGWLEEQNLLKVSEATVHRALMVKYMCY